MRTSKNHVGALVVVGVLWAMGCGGDDRPAGDAGRVDAARTDGSARDSGPLIDSGRRDGARPADAGPPTDAGPCPASEATPYGDHTMNEEFTDPAVCTGCPGPFTDAEELDVGTLSPGTTAVTITAAALGASSCEWWVIGGACGVTHGSAGTDPDGSGAFSVTVPIFCGSNVIQIACSTSAGRRVLVRRIMGEACERDVRVTLQWDAVGDDLELHLIREGGSINSATDDCTWFTCMGADGLEWGTAGDTSDNPRKDIDDLDDFGPENIYLERAPAGTYHIMVEHWGTLGAPSDATVDIAIGERTVAHVEELDLQTHWVWYVGTVRFPEGTFTEIDTLTDCSAPTAWNAGGSRGCGLMLP